MSDDRRTIKLTDSDIVPAGLDAACLAASRSLVGNGLSDLNRMTDTQFESAVLCALLAYHAYVAREQFGNTFRILAVEHGMDVPF